MRPCCARHLASVVVTRGPNRAIGPDRPPARDWPIDRKRLDGRLSGLSPTREAGGAAKAHRVEARARSERVAPYGGALWGETPGCPAPASPPN
jgi:hypothetical protein